MKVIFVLVLVHGNKIALQAVTDLFVRTLSRHVRHQCGGVATGFWSADRPVRHRTPARGRHTTYTVEKVRAGIKITHSRAGAGLRYVRDVRPNRAANFRWGAAF